MKVRFFSVSEFNLLLKSIERLWGKNHIYCRNPELLKYMVYNTPYRKQVTTDDNTTFIGLFDGNKVVGLSGMMPQMANIFGKKVLSTTGTIWIVDKEYKLEGLELLKYLLSFKPGLHVGPGINTKVKKLYKMLKWETFDDFPRWIGTKNVEKLKSSFNIPNKFLLKDLERIEQSDSQNYVFDDTINEEKWDEFYNKKFAKKTIGTARDFKFLKWRYVDYPFFDYKLISLTTVEQEYKGLVVYRVENIEIGGNKAHIGRILEIIYDDLNEGIRLVQHMINAENNILFWDFYCLSSVTALALEYIGFRRLPPSENEKYIPTRFHPVDYEVMNIQGTIYIDEKIKKFLKLVVDQQWYVTRGDGDQDRPN